MSVSMCCMEQVLAMMRSTISNDHACNCNPSRQPHTEEQLGHQCFAQTAPWAQAQHHAMVLDAALPVRCLAVLLVLELDEVGIGVVLGDDDLLAE
uniref:Uncharacterized protein n=1 Tax=Arundo donax TaxID=35708 RepID=A0A0A8YNN0_ARUDO